MDERSRRVGQAITESGANWAILTSPDAVCYASDHEVPIETGPLPTAGGPSCAFVAADGSVALVVVNAEERSALAGQASIVRAYEGYSYRHQAPAKENFTQTVLTLVGELGVGGVVAVQGATYPASLREALQSVVSQYVDITPALTRVRATKTALELDRLRYVADLTAIGQQAALEHSLPGRQELEVLADIRCAMEVKHGKRLPLINDLLSGADRTAQATGLPTSTRVVRDGDPIICDLAPRANGYWGDSCNTFVVGEPNRKLVELYRLVKLALDHGREILRPGITAGQFDAEVRAVIQRAGYDYRHHTGHGIGTAVHEYPLLVSEETAVLSEDMVLLVEPGAYVEGVGGVRLEWMFHVTADGCEVLSPFEHVLQAPHPQQTRPAQR